MAVARLIIRFFNEDTLFADREARREGSPKFLVRQQNIERVHDPEMVTPTLMEQAGRYFRKFNKQNCAFMSNIREMYPDD